MEIVQIKPEKMSDQSIPLPQQHSVMESSIDLLVEQHQVVRILQPGLRRQIDETVRLTPSLGDYAFDYRGELYLSLMSIGDGARRAQIYDLIQRYQIDQNVELDKVPYGLRACLQAEKYKQGRLMGAIALGATIGVLIGLIGMAISVLFTAVMGLPETRWEMVTAVAFVVCCVLGWVAATYYLWYKYPLGFWRN